MKSRFIYLPLFFLATVLIYFSAISSIYGLRDDYSITRETHEEPGKVLVFTASHGRPLYGVFLELSYRHLRSVDDLEWLRLLSAVFIAAFGFALFRQLQENGWPTFEALAVAFIAAYLPASQVTVSWAVGWPWGISLILTVIGFRLVEEAWLKTGLAQIGIILCAVLFYLLSTLIYQSNTLFAVPLLASLLLSPTIALNTQQAFKRCVFHMTILFVGLFSSYLLLKWLFAVGVFQASGRLQFETDIYSKVLWFLSNCIPNAIAFVTLRDDFNTGAVLFWCVFSVVTSLLFFAAYKSAKHKKIMIWLVCLLVFPWLAHSISLVAAERSLGYRTTYALSGLALVLLVVAVRDIFSLRLRYAILSLLVIVMAIQAHLQSFYLIAQPQSHEWSQIKKTVAKLPVGVKAAVYLIEPQPADRSTDRVYRDEFGSFTTNSSWTPDEMFKLALHQRFPNGIPKHWHYQFYHGGSPPPPGHHYSYIIDERTLKHWRK